MWCGCGGDEAHLLGRRRARSISACEPVDLVVALGAAGAADDQQQRVGAVAARRGRAPRRRGPSAAGSARRTAAPGTSARQVERLARPASIAGGEERMLDTGGDDLDAAARVAVQPAELALLLRAADADRVGAADDLVLGTLAPQRLEVAALGLDLGERVERADERQVELVLDAVGDDAAEPVVGVERRRPGSRREVLDDARRRTRRAPPGSCSLARSNGPAGTCTTRWPGSTWTTSGRPGRSARVYVVHSTPAWASAETSSRTYTFMPPLSPGARLQQRRRVE